MTTAARGWNSSFQNEWIVAWREGEGASRCRPT